MNEFRYIISATRELQQGLILWRTKIKHYVNIYYQGNEYNANNTDFYRCISKIRELDNNLLEREEDFRGVIDNQGLLAAACIVQEEEVEVDEQPFPCLEIISLTNSPWNAIAYLQPEKRKGAATSLIEGIVRESQRKGFNGIVKLTAIQATKEFYRKLEFAETNGSGEMILTSNSASMFLLDQEKRRESTNFD